MPALGMPEYHMDWPQPLAGSRLGAGQPRRVLERMGRGWPSLWLPVKSRR